MYDTCISDRSKQEFPYKVAVITFGSSVDYHTPYTNATQDFANNLSRFYANGTMTLRTDRRMAKNLIEDENVTKSKCYRPAVCQSLSIGIVNDSDYNMIKSFASEDTEKISCTDKHLTMIQMIPANKPTNKILTLINLQLIFKLISAGDKNASGR